jgi:CheY-like chemotaxis protein
MSTQWMRKLGRSEPVGTKGFNGNQVLNWQESNHETTSHSEYDAVLVPRVLNVLIVDDYRDTADVFALLVKCWGHDSHAVNEASAALEWAATRQPDVVLLDIEMPEIGGCQIARVLRNELGYADCLIIAITGRADFERRQQCKEAGIDVVLLKPVDPTAVETLLMLECARVNRRGSEEALALVAHGATSF